MKKYQIIFLLTISFLSNQSLNAQPFYAHLSFTNPQIIGNKFRISLNVASVGQTWNIGHSNFRIDYTLTALANPIIILRFFQALILVHQLQQDQDQVKVA